MSSRQSHKAHKESDPDGQHENSPQHTPSSQQRIRTSASVATPIRSPPQPQAPSLNLPNPRSTSPSSPPGKIYASEKAIMRTLELYNQEKELREWFITKVDKFQTRLDCLSEAFTQARREARKEVTYGAGLRSIDVDLKRMVREIEVLDYWAVAVGKRVGREIEEL